MTTTSNRPDTKDLKYMSNPMLWVTMVCPLKRYVKDAAADGNRIEFAYLVGDGPNLYHGYHGSMFSARRTDPVTQFASYEAIVAEGWMVD